MHESAKAHSASHCSEAGRRSERQPLRRKEPGGTWRKAAASPPISILISIIAIAITIAVAIAGIVIVVISAAVLSCVGVQVRVDAHGPEWGDAVTNELIHSLSLSLPFFCFFFSLHNCTRRNEAREKEKDEQLSKAKTALL